MTMYYPDYEFYNGVGFLLLYQIEMQFICGINSPRQLPEMPLQEIQYEQEKRSKLVLSRQCISSLPAALFHS